MDKHEHPEREDLDEESETNELPTEQNHDPSRGEEEMSNLSPSQKSDSSGPGEVNHKVDRNPVREMTDADKEQVFADAVHLLMEHPEEVTEIINNLTNEKQIAGTPEELERWRSSLQAALENHPSTLDDVAPFHRPGSYWQQALEHNGERIAAGRPRLGNRGSTSGDAAQLRIRAAAGLGSLVAVPLWHTGIWVKIKAASEGALLELEQRIAQEKITLGRATIGVSFTNAAVYTNYHLASMILDHIYDATCQDHSFKALKETIRVTDLPQLVWGMASAIWPDGYRMVRPCVYDPTECSHTDEAHVDIGKLSWVDQRALTDAQKNHMMDRESKVSSEALKTYQDQHLAPQYQVVDLNDSLSVKLRVPTIAEYERAGFRWVDEIVRMTDEAFGREIQGKDRDQYILKQGILTNLRRYSHFIEEIRIKGPDDSEDVVQDRDTIDSTLDDLTSSEQIRETLIESIETFIRHAVINAIGIPRYDCPACGRGPSEDTLPHRLSEIMELEVNEIFFTLQSIRTAKVLQSS